MTLRGRRINIFIRLWCLVASGGLHICVLSTSFQKNYLSWPQQPPTEKVQKFNMIFDDSNLKQLFFKHKNKAEFKCQYDSEVLSSGFSGLKTSAASMTSPASTASMASMTSTASFHQKKMLILMIWSSPESKWPIQVPICGIDRKKPNFSLISDTLPEEAVEASQCHFFENWLIKHKCAILLKLLGTII